MNIEALGLDAFLLPSKPLPEASPAERAIAGDKTAGFGALVSSGLSELNAQLLDGQHALQKLAVGDAPDLHRVMMQLEESRITFQLVMQVRNRLLEAYQDIMKMQI